MSPKHLVHRAAGAVVVMVLASFLAASLVNLVPGDAAQTIAGETATAEQVQVLREKLGTDDPVIEQYGSWAWGVLQGDLGRSIVTDRPVWSSITEAAPPTLSITLLAAILAVVIGMGLGAVAGLRNGTWVDRAASIGATVGIAMPSFWVGLLLVSFFALDHTWLPATGYEPLSSGLGVWLRHAILPAVALGLATAAEIARQTRSGVVDVLSRLYIRTAQAKGASGVGLVRRHVLRNTAIPVVTVLGLQVGRLLGGAVVVEAVFGISGLGTLAVTAVLRRDLPLIQGYILFVSAIIVIVNLITDISYGLIDPKVRAA